MVFLRNLRIGTLRDKLCSCEIRKVLIVEPLLLRIEKSQLLWFGHMANVSHRVPQKIGDASLAGCTHGKSPIGRPMTRRNDQISDFAWSRLGVEPTELSEITVDREVFEVLPGFYPASLPTGKAGTKINE